jgi:hypothetical protein
VVIEPFESDKWMLETVNIIREEKEH